MKKAVLWIFMFAVLISASASGQTQTYKISGKVVNEKTGAGVAKAFVSFQPQFLTVYIEPAVTDADGNYTIQLNEGAYYVSVKHPDFEPFMQKEIKISSDLTMDFKLVPVAPPVEIKNYVMGTVLDNQTAQPVTGASVNLLPTDGRKIYIGTASDKAGNFTLQNIPEGDYYLNASMQGYLPYKDAGVLSIKADTKIQDVKITLAKDTAFTNNLVKSVKFYVYKIDASGSRTGVPQAKILLMGAMNNQYTGVTDANGVFILEEAVAGFYKVMVSDGINTTYTSVEIKKDVPTFEIEIKAPAPVEKGTIKGKVISSADLKPLPGASVFAVSAVTDPVKDPKGAPVFYGAVSDVNGEYSLSIAPGDYFIGCNFKSKYESFVPIVKYYDNVLTISEAKKITVTKDAVVSGINFSLDTPPAPQYSEVTISGKLTSVSGDPVAEAKLVVYERTKNMTTGTLVKSGTDGKYSAVVKLVQGEHELMIGVYGVNYQPQFYNGKSSLYEADLVKLNITSDKAALENIDFSLSPVHQEGSYAISGRVVDEEKNPVEGACVELYGSFNKAITGVTDAAGYYKISGLPVGKYIVGFSAKGYLPQFYREALTWEKALPIELTSNVSGIDAVLKKAGGNAMNTPSAAGKITGRILAGDNTPVSGVRIILATTDGNVIAADISDSQGGYYLEGVSGGTYKLIASRVNYQSIEKEINTALDKSGESILNINLSSATGVKDLSEKGRPTEYILENNYPNPFNPSTRIRFALPEASRVTVEIFSVLGQKITTLVDQDMSAGYHEVTFNAEGLSSGIYIYKMNTATFTQSKLMHLLK